MDKKLILAVAGSGKTSFIIDSINLTERITIITYTNNNYNILEQRIISKFGHFPSNIFLYTYFDYLYNFCTKPFEKLLNTKGLFFVKGFLNDYSKSNVLSHYLNKHENKWYHHRLAKMLVNFQCFRDGISNRITKYNDTIYIDESQDFGGNDFDFLLFLFGLNINVFVLGDYFQHTFNTSYDGNKNKTLYNDYFKYKKKFAKDITIDETTLSGSYRCAKQICDFVANKLEIQIKTNNTRNNQVSFLTAQEEIDRIISDTNTTKLFLSEHYKYNLSKTDNWGNCKGSTFSKVCVIVNKTIMKQLLKDGVVELPPTTKNKLYVALTRSEGDLYILEDKYVNHLKIMDI